MKRYLTLGLLVALVFSVGMVLAAKPDSTPHKTSPSGGHPPVVIPAHAVKVAPGVFYLGTAIDNGRVVKGYAFIDYKKGFGKPTCNNNGICEPELGEKKSCSDCKNGGGGNGEADTSNCYGFLSKGAKWKTIEPYIVNPTNAGGLTGTFVTSNLAADIDKWETAAGVDILGNGSATNDDLARDFGILNSKNEVYFADIEEPGVIAVAITWGIYSGPPWQRELVEWDQVYDQEDFDWSATGEAGKMDFENIATHELGHSVGLDDLYDGKCSEQTMYGYAGYGETEKRTLEAGDITGIRKLYS